RSGVPGGGGAGHGARAGGGLDPGGPGAGPERGARHPHRHRLARRPAARAERKAGSQAVMGRNPRVSKILRASGYEGRITRTSRKDVTKETSRRTVVIRFPVTILRDALS